MLFALLTHHRLGEGDHDGSIVEGLRRLRQRHRTAAARV